ncbi:MAG: RNase adapter RapZ [Silicimonas sp.]|nr:RNase adapter RapZ [Silicimonas sp.]
MTEPAKQPTARVVFVMGPSGAGRSTAINVFEDLGFDTIHNLPLSLFDRVVSGSGMRPALALGIDVRNRDFSVDALLSALEQMTTAGIAAELVYLDCTTDVLLRRYSETRRRHPLAPSEPLAVGIEREIELLQPIRERADHLIDTSNMTPHDLKAEIERRFADDGAAELVLSVESFSYKRGLPRGVDMIFDVRFLANPHWEPELRNLDGRAPDVAAYVSADARFSDFFTKMSDLVESLLPAFKAEGKTYLSVGLGCTGGQHRSVAVAEKLANALAKKGWQVSTRHRELERRGLTASDVGTSQ